MNARKSLFLMVGLVVVIGAAVVVRNRERSSVPTPVALSQPSPTPHAFETARVSASAAAPEPRALPATPAPVENRPPPEEAVRLDELNTSLIRQRYATGKRLEALAEAAGDYKDVLPAQVKRYKEPEMVLILAQLLRDPNWEPMFSDYIQHRFGFERTRLRLHMMETSLGNDAGLSTARDAAELKALLFRAEPVFQQRSNDLAAKFQLADEVVTEAREMAMLETLEEIVKDYRYWAINKNRQDIRP